MKTTVEIDGYEITIEKTGDKISVTACKGDDCMEEFTLDAEGVESDEEFDEELPEMEEENDFEDAENAEEEAEEAEEDAEEAEDETKLESFRDFIYKRDRKPRRR